jgi:maltooligosyltrehalose trehalohydrolase
MRCAFLQRAMTRSPDLKPVRRRFPIGVEVHNLGSHFRVWAPDHRAVHLVIEDKTGASQAEIPLSPEPNGYFSRTIPNAPAGTLYRYRFGDESDRFPDPASRFQPSGPHGPSQIVDPATFTWTDAGWKGVGRSNQVLYEMHVGTFTDEGTWRAALDHLPALAELGITTIEVMPVAEFAGLYGWGYDGVDLFAPSHLYGDPDDFRRFVDRAHALGLGVILDVVYNHLGPDGNYLRRFASAYFTSRYANEWGDAINFDENAAPVRELIVSNAVYWITEFHLDGLRFDATQQIFDASPTHLLAEIAAQAREVAGDRLILLVAENEPQDVTLVRSPRDGGFGLDGLWNDDFHHTAVVALTGRREAYYTDYVGTPQEFISLVKWGFLYQGQRYSWQRARRGTAALGLEPARFITFLQNHDQVANDPSGRGQRLHELCDAGRYRAMTAYWLLAPGTPMFFQGQEFAASSPFMYFADHQGDLGAAVRKGRAEFLAQFRSAPKNLIEVLPDPADAGTFTRCRLRHEERDSHREVLALHRDLLQVRREDQVFRIQRGDCIEGAVLGPSTFALRYFAANPYDPDSAKASHEERLVIVNLGGDLHFDPAPEPLLAPPAGTGWHIRWSSEDLAYGGRGTAPLDTDTNWEIPGHATVVLAPRLP